MRCNKYSAASASLSCLVKAQAQSLPEKELDRLLALQVRPKFCSVRVPAPSRRRGSGLHALCACMDLDVLLFSQFHKFVSSHECMNCALSQPCRSWRLWLPLVRSAEQMRRAAPWHCKPGSGGRGVFCTLLAQQ